MNSEDNGHGQILEAVLRPVRDHLGVVYSFLTSALSLLYCSLSRRRFRSGIITLLISLALRTAEFDVIHIDISCVMSNIGMVPVLIGARPQAPLQRYHFTLAEIATDKFRSLSPCHTGDEICLPFTRILIRKTSVCGNGEAAR